MLEITYKEAEDLGENVEKGQIRYNSEGMYVLITLGLRGNFDAVVLSKGFAVEQFDWNSRGISASEIERIYPFIGKGKMEISK